jgi:hypothetical protein
MIGLPTLFLVTFLGLNYSGFCFEKMRYLTDYEKMRLAFNYINNAEKLRVKVPEKGHEYRKFIPYESFDEYIQENPNCCMINPPGGSDAPPPRPILYYSRLDRIFGYNSGDLIVIRYKVRYLDKKGNQISQSIKVDSALQNCGKVLEWYD